MSEKQNPNLLDLYLRFRWLVDGLKTLPSADVLSIPNVELLLADITQAWKSGEPYPINKLLDRQEIGHFNTVRKRIHQLKDAGLVELQGSDADSRVKLVVPTAQALRYFEEYAAVIRQVSK
ncbi:MAG: hypothetical protein ACO329_08395 [Steroidobacteraceae bacterium]|jgi:hypothetical protein